MLWTLKVINCFIYCSFAVVKLPIFISGLNVDLFLFYYTHDQCSFLLQVCKERESVYTWCVSCVKRRIMCLDSFDVCAKLLTLFWQDFIKWCQQHGIAFVVVPIYALLRLSQCTPLLTRNFGDLQLQADPTWLTLACVRVASELTVVDCYNAELKRTQPHPPPTRLRALSPNRTDRPTTG